MNYASRPPTRNLAAMAGALAIPVAIGTLLVTGLTITGVIREEVGPLVNLTPATPTPTPTQAPIEPAKTEIPPRDQSNTVITAPDTPFEWDSSHNAPIDKLPPSPPLPPTPYGPENSLGDGIGDSAGAAPTPTPSPVLPSPTPALFDPVAAKPRNNPGSWVTDSDYRSNWIRREMQGTARFRLAISASGRVTGCTIVGSTGHAELDQATCRLIEQRARFEPARDKTGAVAAGTYTNAVNWRMP